MTSPLHQSPSGHVKKSIPVTNSRSASYSSAPANIVEVHGRSLIVPNSKLARAVVMGNDVSAEKSRKEVTRQTFPVDSNKKRPASNLTLLLSEQHPQLGDNNSPDSMVQPRTTEKSLSHRDDDHLVQEADSASGPTHGRPPALGSSAPVFLDSHNDKGPASFALGPPIAIPDAAIPSRVRRCLSSKEIGTLAPPSGSPYATMLHKKEELEIAMRNRLRATRLPENHLLRTDHNSEDSSTSSRSRRETANELRNRRRAEHAQAVVDDLCSIVADLFIAESKLLNPSRYGVQHQPRSDPREQLEKTIHSFVTALPLRYALTVDNPSEVLLHMRLMAAVQADKTKAVVHIHDSTQDKAGTHASSVSHRRSDRSIRLVTISCRDASGLLEYISKLLATGGSSVLDADVMLTKDGIILDRFVVEMNGRLRLDRLANLIEAFLRDHVDYDADNASTPERSPAPVASSPEPGGPLYYQEVQHEKKPLKGIREEMESAVPLTDVLASTNRLDFLQAPSLPQLRRLHSMPNNISSVPDLPQVHLPMRGDVSQSTDAVVPQSAAATQSAGRQRGLVNRPAYSYLDNFGVEREEPELDYFMIPSSGSVGSGVEHRLVPLIPFDELMLIETLGAGRVSTIYRAAWQREHGRELTTPVGVQMVALKVAMVNPTTGDTSHVDELRREADIAARLSHPNICDLVGVAADAECFCLAYDYCEGGSLLSLLSDSSRYYEYLPIALDIANGMAYLHSRNIIHRDLKPSNILLTKDRRAKIADFGMSVADAGQEHTAETGTYRFMAPEVIRHESYSSNADVYSFGICLFQLITREIPFATLTPIQAAYAVAEGRRPELPASTPRRLQEIITACWDQDSHRRPSFTYVAMALADYAKMAFSPANVGAQTLSIANEMLATVEGCSNVNADFTTPVSTTPPEGFRYLGYGQGGSQGSINNVGLEIE